MADKTKSIKEATDKELDELIFRLRKESEVQNLLSDIKRKSGSGYMLYDYGQEISTEKPIESLYHFGILGMRWGKRKAGLKKAFASSKKKDMSGNDSEDYKKKTVLKKKNMREMTNAELRTLNERLQLERQYKDLTKAETSAGRKFVMDILAGAAKQTASTYVSKYMGKGVEQLLKKTAK